MPKITLPTLESGYLSAEAINTAFAEIETAINNTLSRDGSSPNQMEADLDLNGHTILNTSQASDDPDRVATYQDVLDAVEEHSSGLISVRTERQIASSAQTVFNLSALSYEVGTSNLAVYVNGVRKFPDYDFEETDSSTVTFLVGLALNDEVDFVASEYTATISVEAHTHPWNQITNLPDYASRWPTWTEVTGKPTTFAPTTHNHAASEITSGRLADARRGVHVQATQPTASTAGELWIW